MSEIRDEITRNLDRWNLQKSKQRRLSSRELKAANAAAALDSIGLTRPTAWAMSKLPDRGSYEEELAQSRDLQDRFRDQEGVAGIIPRGLTPKFLFDGSLDSSFAHTGGGPPPHDKGAPGDPYRRSRAKKGG